MISLYDMAKKDSILLQQFGELMTQAVTSVIGVRPLRLLIAREFPGGEVTAESDGTLVILGDIKIRVPKLIGSLTDLLVRDFGHAFTNQLFRRIYVSFLSKYRENPQFSELIASVPEGFLEDEKVRFLSKEELERRVLQKTKELQELNENLEKTVLERTKELVVANQRLENANRELEHLGKAKTEFLSLTSHQLRVPLAAARWGILALREELTPVLKKEHVLLLEKLLANNERMVRLINNLLNVARIEEGRFTYQFEEVSLADVVSETLVTLSEFARTKSVTLDYKPSKVLFLLRADKEKLSMAVENVLDNAIKYTPEGMHVTIVLRQEDSRIVLSISDQGIGIPKDEQKRVFDKFFRAKNAIAAEVNGSGLGLFIVKKIVEDHGGHITFQSEEGKGTTFFLEFPRGAEKQ